MSPSVASAAANSVVEPIPRQPRDALRASALPLGMRQQKLAQPGPKGSHHTKGAATSATGLHGRFPCFCSFGRVSADPLLLLPEFGGSLSFPSFRVLARRDPRYTNRQTSTRPATRYLATKATAATPTTAARKEERETLGSAIVGVPRSRRAGAAVEETQRPSNGWPKCNDGTLGRSMRMLERGNCISTISTRYLPVLRSCALWLAPRLRC
jgi:hypothetical protein